MQRGLRPGVVRMAARVPHVGPGTVAAAPAEATMPDGFIVTLIKSLILANLVMARVRRC